jgi:hypothetical protein
MIAKCERSANQRRGKPFIDRRSMQEKRARAGPEPGNGALFVHR